MDRIETNFRFMLLSQREMNAKLSAVGSQMAQIATALTAVAAQVTEVAAQVTEVAAQVAEVADKGEETADRLDDCVLVMKSFADGQAEIRAKVDECMRRLDVLEGKKAS